MKFSRRFTIASLVSWFGGNLLAHASSNKAWRVFDVRLQSESPAPSAPLNRPAKRRLQAGSDGKQAASDTPETYVIAEPCIDKKDTACLDVCPVDCIHPTKDEPNFGKAKMLYIDPEECICCGACVDVCPVSAIFDAIDLPDKWLSYIEINRAYYGEDESK